jgi:hypothetical protein
MQSKKTEATTKPEAPVVTEQATASPTTPTTNDKGDRAMTTNNGNGSYGKREVKLADMKTIELTQAAFGKLTPTGLVAKLINPKNPAINVISRERAKDMLVERITAGKVKLTAAALMDLTYKNVIVEGVAPEALKGVRGVAPENAKETLTQEQFGKLKPAKVAAYVEKFTHKRRVAGSIIPAYILAGMPMSAEDVVYITNSRVAVEGVVVKAANGAKSEAIVEGVEFG